jgi:integrase
LRLITWRQLDFASQRITLAQHKTGGVVTRGFSVPTKDKLLELNRYGFDRILPMSKTVMRRLEGKLFLAASELGFVRQRGQGLGVLRKTHGTEVYRDHGIAAAAESLGHSSGVRVTRRHYIDSSAEMVYVPAIG